MAKKKKTEDETRVVGRLGANGEIAPFESARILGRVDDKGNRTPYIQAQKEQEIAPTKSTWLKKGALDDSGYAYTGTLDKINRFNASLFMSAVDALGNVGLGITKPIEGIGDFTQSRFADVQELFGDKLGAELTRKKVAQEWKVNKDLEEALASDNGMGIDDMSFIGQKGKAIPQGIGSVLLASASGGLGQIAGGTGAIANVASLGTMGVGAAGNAEQEALEQGATRKEARMYGLISGVGETLSEMMFGGLSKGSQVLGIGTGVFDSVDDAIASGLTKKIENKIVKNLIEAGVKATGEGVEEVVSGIFEAVGKKLTYMSDEDIAKLLKDENLLDSFLSGAISAGISQAPGYIQSITTNEGGKLRLQTNEEIRDYITNLNEQEQRVVEQEIQDRINEEGKVSKKRRIEIEKQVIEDLDRGYINADKIEKTLGEDYNQQRDTRLAESFNERNRRSEAYQNDISKYSEKEAKVIQTAIDSGLLNNSNKTHDFVDLIAKISADKGVDFDFTNNERIKDTGFGIEGKTVNGYVQDGKVTLNLESNQALNKTVGHEITHVLEGSEVYQELQNSLKSYLGEREWNNRIKDLSETYKNVENANVENELTADLVGDYIFNDEAFVRNLSTRNQNLFQKIYDEIKYLVKIATAGSKEARELEKAKKVFEKAYRDASKTSTEGKTQYSIQGLENYSEQEIKDIANDYIQQKLNESGLDDIEIVDSAIHGSRGRGTAKENSDLDIVVEYKGDIREDDLFNLLNDAEDKLNIEGIDVDINPITESDTGNLTDYMKRSNQYDKEVLNNAKFSLSVGEANTGKSNNGVELSEGQQEYFKNSKATDENGNLITVYHTTTNETMQFNEFNPVGTEYYRFGDQVVNYYTDSKEMSGSYADQNYVMADTKKISSIEDVKNLIEEHNKRLNPEERYDYIVELESMDGGTYRLKVESQPVFNANEVFYPRSYLTKEDLFKNIKNDLENYYTIRNENGMSLSKEHKYQYEGYVDITNPYIVDAEERNWNQVVQQSNQFIDDLVERVSQDTKDRLTNLYNESQNISAESIDEFNAIDNAITNINQPYLSTNLDNDTRIANKIVRRAGFDNVETFLNGGNPNIDFWYTLASELKEANIINDVESRKIVDDFIVSDNVKQWLNDNYTKEIKSSDFATERAVKMLGEKTSLKDLYNRRSDLYENYDKYRYENSYFLEQLEAENSDYLDSELEDIFETRAEIKGAETVAQELGEAAKNGFSKSQLIRLWGTSKTTNDIVKEVIKSNTEGTTDYDGVIIKNVYDYGGKSEGKSANDLYVTFNSNQFKAVDNLNPTNDADIRYQLGNRDIAPTNGWEVRSEDVRLQSAFQNAIAPIQEQVQQLNNSIAELKENIPQYKAENIQDEETDFSDVSIKNMTADDINYEPFMNYAENSSELGKERQQLRNELNQKKEVFIPKEKSSLRNTVDTLKALFTNKNVEIDNLAKESGNLNIKYAGDMANNTAAEAQTNIENAQTNNEGKAIGRSLRSIFNEAREQGLEEALNDYLLNWSNIDRHKQGKGSNISSEDSYKLVKQYEEKYPELKEMAKDVWQYSRNARHNLRDAGIINQDVSDMLGRMYPHYVPYISDGNDSYFVDMGELKPRQAIKRAKGGAIQETLLPVEEALTRYTYAQKKAVRQNELYKEIVKTIGDNVLIGGDVRTDYTNMADSLYRDRNGNYLTAYENGEQITTRISDNLYKSLSNELENNVKDIEQKLSFITKPLQKISQIRRDILTKWSPTFPIKNAIKDIQDAALNSKYTNDFLKYTNPVSYMKTLNELAQNTELAAQFKSLYGSGTAMGQYDVDSGLYQANKGAKNTNFLKNVANKVEGLNDLIELTPRYAEFKASLDNGCSLQEAMYNAREVTTNFSRGGVITKALNRNGFTFLNASVQGLSKFIRNFSGENGAMGITNSLAKAAIFGIAPAVFNELAFGVGDDKDEEYEALPDYIKDNYYLIKLSDGTFVRIPKGRMLSVFGSAARRTIEAMEGEEDAFKGYLQNVNSQIGVNNPEENNIFAPLIQAYGSENGTAWYGGDLIPTRLQNVPKAEQYDESTDKMSIWLGEKLGISPYKLNYVLDQYTGGLGDIFLPMITEEATSTADNPVEYLSSWVKDEFSTDSTTKNKYVSDFYSKNDELKVNANSAKATDEDLIKKKYMSGISSEMAELYKERREVQSSNLSKEQKYKKAQTIKDEINRLAKEGLDNYNNVIVEGNYAQVGDNEYYKNANGEWTKAKDETKELGLTPQEKSEYYNTKSQISETKKNNDGSDKPLVIQDIVNSNLTPEAKANLYTTNYKDDLINPMIDLGTDVDSYLTFKAQDFKADKDSNGKSISGSKKQKVFDYINSMNIPYEQKLILAKSEYNSFNDNNVEILEYINNSNMSYDEKMTLIKNLGFKVDGNNVSW